jgi:hypothetical protein
MVAVCELFGGKHHLKIYYDKSKNKFLIERMCYANEEKTTWSVSNRKYLISIMMREIKDNEQKDIQNLGLNITDKDDETMGMPYFVNKQETLEEKECQVKQYIDMLMDFA